MKSTLKFNQEWFKKQFGPRPWHDGKPRTEYDLKAEIAALESALSYARQELFNLQIYNAQESAALKSFVNTIYELKTKR